MEKVIVTGANGFLGSAITRLFLSRGVDVLAIVHHEEPTNLNTLLSQEQMPPAQSAQVQSSSVCSSNSQSSPAQPSHAQSCDTISLPSSFGQLLLRTCDITDLDKLAHILENDAQGYDAFIHMAWRGAAGPTRSDYQLQMSNALDCVHCLELAARSGIKRFLAAGSIMEYEVGAAIHGQDARPGLAYYYGLAKVAAHALCKIAASKEGIDLIWPIITNAYGPGERSPRFVNTTLRKIISHEPLEFTSATQKYDFIYIDDLAEAFYAIADKGQAFREYIVGSGNAQPLRGFIEELRDAVAPDQELHFGDIPFTGVDMQLSVFDTSTTQADTGFKATTSFGEGCRRTMDWLIETEGHEKANGGGASLSLPS